MGTNPTDRTYYSRSTRRAFKMVSRGEGIVELQAVGHDHRVRLPENELDGAFCTSLSELDDRVGSSGDEAGVVKLEDRGGASKYEVKARRGLVPPVVDWEAAEQDHGPLVVGGGKLGSCSICGDGSGGCEHVTGEPASLRVVEVRQVDTVNWNVLMGNGQVLRVVVGADGDPYLLPRRKNCWNAILSSG